MADAPNTATADHYALTGEVWKPRLAIYAGPGLADVGATPDQLIPSAISAKCERNNFFQADKFVCTFSLWEHPQFSYQWWASWETLSILVKIAWEGVMDYTEVFRGFVDKIIIDPVRGVVTVTGRNQISQLIDTQVKVDFQHGTIGDIIKELMDKAGMLTDEGHLVFEPGFPVDRDFGRYYNELKTEGAVGGQSLINPWDMIITILEMIGGSTWTVEGVTHFGLLADGDVYWTVLAPKGVYEGQLTKLTAINATRLTIEHDLTISQYNHQVRSHSTQPNGKTETAKYPGEFEDNGKPTQPRDFYVGNREPEDNDSWAKSYHAIYTLHEWVVTATIAGPQAMGLMPNHKLDLVGTDTDMDGWYQIVSIEHSIDFRKGYQCTVKAQWGKSFLGANADVGAVV